MSSFVVLLALSGIAPPVEPDPAPPPDRREGALADNLWGVSREVDLGGADAVSALFLRSREAAFDADALDREKGFVGPPRPRSLALRQLASGRDDLRGLPFLSEREAHLGREAREVLHELSRQLAVFNRRGGYPSIAHAGVADLFRTDVARLGAAAPRLEQLAMAEPEATRASLIGTLDRIDAAEPFTGVLRSSASFGLIGALVRIDSAEARRTLARRATFDLSPAVRRLAREALKDASPKVTRPVLLAALRHPWPPAAHHAARALVEMRDAGALLALRDLVNLPPPDEPYREGGRWLRPGVARIDHLRNCLLCHPAAARVPDSSAVLGTLQRPGTPLAHDEDKAIDRVHAHVVFLRQDVSALRMLPRGDGTDWPLVRRFDFLPHVRPMTDAEHKEYLAQRAEVNTYPQREAVRWAIRELSR